MRDMGDRLQAAVKAIGIIVLSFAVYIVPVLIVLSFTQGFPGGVKLILIVIMIVQLCGTAVVIDYISD